MKVPMPTIGGPTLKNIDAVLEAMREWIDDCFADQVDAWELADHEVWRGVDRHFEGGTAEFIRTAV